MIEITGSKKKETKRNPDMDMIRHLRRQIGFSEKTFGPGSRHGGVTDHIRKELMELGAPPDDLEEALNRRLPPGGPGYHPEIMAILRDRAIRRGQVEEPGDPKEWVDVVLLALDGLWRSLRARYGELTNTEIAALAVEMIDAKQTRNESRDWPDWRTMSSDRAIEHDRRGEQPRYGNALPPGGF